MSQAAFFFGSRSRTNIRYTNMEKTDEKKMGSPKDLRSNSFMFRFFLGFISGLIPRFSKTP
jgi:hypothetical protein